MEGSPPLPVFPTGDLPHDSRQSTFIALIITFTVLATICVVLRFYARIVLVKNFGYDDWAILGALLCMYANCVTTIIYIKYWGIGKHIWDVRLTGEEHILGSKMQLTTQLLYNPILAFTKASILLFYRRISSSRTFQIWIWTTMAFNVALGIAIFITDLFQCTPISYFWDMTSGGKCINSIAFYFSTAALSVVTDFWILVLPMPLLWRLQLPMRRRLMLMGLFSLGGGVVVMSILRFIAFHRLFFVTKDPTYDDSVIWSTLECTLAIVCASIPAFRPLFSQPFPRLFGLSSLQQSSGYNNNKPGSAGVRQPYSRSASIITSRKRQNSSNNNYALEAMNPDGLYIARASQSSRKHSVGLGYLETGSESVERIIEDDEIKDPCAIREEERSDDGGGYANRSDDGRSAMTFKEINLSGGVGRRG